MSVAPFAQGTTSLSLSIKTSGAKVLYGHVVTLSGRLSSGAAGRRVVISARPIGARARTVGSVTTAANGGWSLRLRPSIETSYQARSGSVVTPAVSVDVEPLLATRVLGSGAILASVVAGRSFAGRTLELQRSRGERWSTAERVVLNRRSEGVFRAPITGGSATLRVAFSVNQAGRGFLGATTHAFSYRAGPELVTLVPSRSNVTFGRAVTLEGRVSLGRRGQRVTILARPYDSTTERTATVTTVAGGRFSFRSVPRIETLYRARWDGVASRPFTVGVRPSLAIGLRANDRVAVAVLPAGTFRGRNVELQQAVGARWHTVQELPLAGSNGAATFALPASGTRFRVAISVNEAGAGYLSAASEPLARASGSESVSLAPSSFRVLYGHAVTLSGRVSNGRGGDHVSILARPYGSSVTLAATVVTGAGGRWSFRSAPTVETTYLARVGARQSRLVVVGVEPRLTVEVLRDGGIATEAVTARPLRGRLVELQELDAASGRWTTIARVPLDRAAGAVFRPSAHSGVVTLRIALSVNQAGVGLLGATSHDFVYRPAAG
jgi:hypothetical protein